MAGYDVLGVVWQMKIQFKIHYPRDKTAPVRPEVLVYIAVLGHSMWNQPPTSDFVDILGVGWLYGETIFKWNLSLVNCLVFIYGGFTVESHTNVHISCLDKRSDNMNR